MTSRVIDMRLRKLEQKASQSALSHLTDAQIIDCLTVAAAPYGGDVHALIEDMRAGHDPADHDLAMQIECMLRN